MSTGTLLHLQRMNIFHESDAPTPACHASTIAESKGSLVAAWFGGQHEKHPDVCIWLSRFEDDVWTTPRKVADGGRSPCWNPVLFQPDDGPLMLFYKVGDTISAWQTWMKTSDDGGLSWSEARHLGGGIQGPVKNKPVQLDDGTILCGASDEPSWRQWQVYFSYTRDLGMSWQMNGPHNQPRDFQAIQPTLLRHGERIQALCRTRQGCISQLWSDDGGRTWSDMTETTVPNPNSGIDAVTLQNGRHLLVYNHTKQGRSPLNLAVSEDGRHWEMIRTLESDSGEFSYPAVIQSADGRIHITYTRQRRTIGYACITMDDLINR